VVDLQVIHPSKGDEIPEGYEVLTSSEQGNGNLSPSFPTKDTYLCVKRSKEGPFITDITLMIRKSASDEDKIPYGFERIDRTPSGLSADLNFGTGSDAVFLCVRRGYFFPVIDFDLVRPDQIPNVDPSFRVLRATALNQDAFLNFSPQILLCVSKDWNSLIHRFQTSQGCFGKEYAF